MCRWDRGPGTGTGTRLKLRAAASDLGTIASRPAPQTSDLEYTIYNLTSEQPPMPACEKITKKRISESCDGMKAEYAIANVGRTRRLPHRVCESVLGRAPGDKAEKEL